MLSDIRREVNTLNEVFRSSVDEIKRFLNKKATEYFRDHGQNYRRAVGIEELANSTASIELY